MIRIGRVNPFLEDPSLLWYKREAHKTVYCKGAAVKPDHLSLILRIHIV